MGSPIMGQSNLSWPRIWIYEDQNGLPRFRGWFKTPKTEGEMDFMVALDASREVPLHKQLYDEVRSAILAGRLGPGQRVPSTREMARSLGVSRTTVTLSYDELLSEGYLEAVVGSGTFVCKELPEELLRTPLPKRAAHYPQKVTPPRKSLSEYGSRLR